MLYFTTRIRIRFRCIRLPLYIRLIFMHVFMKFSVPAFPFLSISSPKSPIVAAVNYELIEIFKKFEKLTDLKNS